MANGKQLAEHNFRAFSQWAASKTDDEFRVAVGRSVLSREAIANECGFAKSALAQNPRIRAALCDLEVALRQRGVLPSIEQPKQQVELKLSEPPIEHRTLDEQRLRRLEHENAGLKAVVEELKRNLSRYSVLQDALSVTGRIPR